MNTKKSVLFVSLLVIGLTFIACEGKRTNVPVTPIPTSAPSETPTVSPTLIPSGIPEITAGGKPASEPTATPTGITEITPTTIPTSTPTITQTPAMTGLPAASPTSAPTSTPTVTPTNMPTAVAECLPTQVPNPKIIKPSIALPTLMPIPQLDVARTEVSTNGQKIERSYDSQDRLIIDISYWYNGNVYNKSYYIYDAEGNNYTLRSIIFSDDGTIFSESETRNEGYKVTHEINYRYDNNGVLSEYSEKKTVSDTKREEILYLSSQRKTTGNVITYVSATDDHIAQNEEYVDNVINTVKKYRYNQYGLSEWEYTEYYDKGVISYSVETDYTAGVHHKEKKVYYKGGKVDYSEEAFYINRDDQQKFIRYYADGSIEYRIEYERNPGFSMTKYSGDNKLIERTTSGNGKKVSEYFDNGVLKERIETEYHPDQSDKIIKETKYTGDNRIEYTMEWTYNSKFCPLSETKYSGDGKLEYRIENTYSSQLYLEYLKESEIRYSADNKQVYRMVWNYDYYNTNRVTLEAKYDADDKLVYKHEWIKDNKVDQLWYDSTGKVVEKINCAVAQGNTGLKAQKTSKGTEFNFVPVTTRPSNISKYNANYFKSVLNEAVGEFEKKGRPSGGLTGQLDILVKSFSEFVYFDYMVIPTSANGKTVIRKFGVGTVCIDGQIKRYYVGDWDKRQSHPNDDSATNTSWYGTNECRFDWDNGHGTFEYSLFKINGKNVYKVVFSNLCLPDDFVPATVYTICFFDDAGIRYIIDYQEKVDRDPMEPKVTNYINFNMRVIDEKGQAYTLNEVDNHQKTIKSKDGQYTLNLWSARENPKRVESECFELISGGYSLFFGRRYTGDVNTEMYIFN